MTRLQVLICTYGAEGLARVAQMQLPRLDGVAYLVSCQSSEQTLPTALLRDDIDVHFTPTIGLSNNRNNAFAHATAPYLLIADDDLRLHPEGLRAIIDIFDADPTLEIATFKYTGPDNKLYPPTEQDLWKPYKHYYVTSFEIAMRREARQRHGLWMNPAFGLNAPRMQSAEEGVMLLVARREGMRARFFPIVIAEHPQLSTGEGERQSHPGVLRAEGAYIALRYPLSAIARLPLKAWRTQGSTMRNLKYLASGAWYAMLHRGELLRTFAACP